MDKFSKIFILIILCGAVLAPAYGEEVTQNVTLDGQIVNTPNIEIAKQTILPAGYINTKRDSSAWIIDGAYFDGTYQSYYSGGKKYVGNSGLTIRHEKYSSNKDREISYGLNAMVFDAWGVLGPNSSILDGGGLFLDGSFGYSHYLKNDLFYGVLLGLNKIDAGESKPEDDPKIGHYLYTNGMVKAGVGRIYSADPIYRAKRIEEVLLQNNVLQREFSDAELIKLADIIKTISDLQVEYPDTYYSKAFEKIVALVQQSPEKINELGGYADYEIIKVLQSEYIYRSYEHGSQGYFYVRSEQANGLVDAADLRYDFTAAKGIDTVGLAYIYQNIIGWDHLIRLELNGGHKYTAYLNNDKVYDLESRFHYENMFANLNAEYTYQISDKYDLLVGISGATSSMPYSDDLADAIFFSNEEANFAPYIRAYQIELTSVIKTCRFRNYLADDMVMQLSYSMADKNILDNTDYNDIGFYHDTSLQIWFTKIL